MTKKELFKKYNERYRHDNQDLRQCVRDILHTAGGMILIAGIEEFFDREIDFRKINK